ncbi:MAG TPA: N-6 DNA methylase [Tepidisphaeraceae bacterium]|nr:N-6 DNA methylase [Tepidisphaeraceae bacterium]
MRRRRGLLADARDGEAAILPLFESDDFRKVLDEDDALGRVYQALNAPTLEAAYRATARERRKFSAEEIPAVTQLFTPRWVVEYLLQNTLGRRWLEVHPDSTLRSAFRWLVIEGSGTASSAEAVDESLGAKRPDGSTVARVFNPCERRNRSENPANPAHCARVENPCHDEAAHPSATRIGQGLRACDLRVLDPACGTMNFGLVAFDMLGRMYREEIAQAGQPGWPAEPSVAHEADIACSVLRGNLFGADIDPVALRLARASLEMKAGVSLAENQWNLRQADSLFDSEIARLWDGTFDVVVTNPPYVSSRNLPAKHVARMKRRFPSAWRDLYASFLDRSLDFLYEGGRAGLLVMQSFMFIGSYEKLRRRIGERAAVESLVHFGSGLFGLGNPGTLQTVACAMRRESNPAARTRQTVTALRLVDVPAGEKERTLAVALRGGAVDRIFRIGQQALSDLPRRSWAYWVGPSLRRAFSEFPRLASVAPPRQGLATTDNLRFVRYWWEVEATSPGAPAQASPARWFPYTKGGQFRRWYEAPRHRVNWEDDGREIKESIARRYPYLGGKWKWVAKNTAYYGRGGVAWSYLTSGQFSARRLEVGAIFDVAGSSLFPADVPGMLAVLNSSVAGRLLGVINPTVNFQVGDLAELPVPARVPEGLGVLATKAIALRQAQDTFDETTTDFLAPMPWANAEEISRDARRQMSDLEREIDAGVCDLYGMSLAGPDAEGDEASFDRLDLARRWVSYAIGLLMGRWKGGSAGRVLRLIPADTDMLDELRTEIARHAGEPAAIEIESQVGGLERFVAGVFFPWHVRLYRKRPPYWALGSKREVVLIAHDWAMRENVLPILRRIGAEPPEGWERHVDDGIAVGLAPLRAFVPDPALRRALDAIAIEAKEGRLAWAGGGRGFI